MGPNINWFTDKSLFEIAIEEDEEKVPESATFDRAMVFVLRWEGGYRNHPNDRGGETNFGISKRAHPDVDIKNLTKLMAKDIYRETYWSRIKGDELPDEVAIAVMDYAVNSGISRASRVLQRIVHAGVDGKIGPNTIKAVETAATLLGDKRVAKKVIMERSDFLCDLVTRREDKAVFLKGWMRRTHALMAEVIGAK